MRALAVSLAMSLPFLFWAAATGQQKKGSGLQLQTLPPAVQKTVQDNLQGGTIKHIARETEHGVQQYEVESVLNGKPRDLIVDTKGKLLSVEEGTAMAAIPAAARTAILKKVAGGKIESVETVTKPGQAPLYEASYSGKNGRKQELLVTADGVETKE